MAANIDYEADLFLYDLTNRAKEYWFKPDEKWELMTATAYEKAVIDKMYFPVVSLKGSPADIKTIAVQVSQSLDPFKEMNVPLIKGGDPVWLLAYTLLRLRT